MKYLLDIINRWVSAGRKTVSDSEQIDWLRVSPFLLLHVSCVLVFWVGVSWIAIAVAVFLYSFRILSIGAFYHRYFSHRCFKTNRFWQFLFAVAGASALQRGPLWWVAHHRHHHAHTDKPDDPHSPIQNHFLWSHMGWFMSKKHYNYDENRVRDLAKFPELRFINQFDVLIPVLLGLSCFLLGHYLYAYHPNLHTNGFQLLVWGGLISTICVFHATVSINSVGHKFGRRRYATNDHSRNNWFLAILTFGEGWHNNHHHHPVSAAQGFFWWEVDLTYYFILLLEKLRIVKDVKKVPQHVLHVNLSESTQS